MIAPNSSREAGSFLTAEGMAELMPYSARMIRRMAENGEIPSYRVGEHKKRLFKPSEVSASLTRTASRSEVLR